MKAIRELAAKGYNKATAVAVVLAAPLLAHADDPFTAAVTEITTKVGTYGAALVGVSAVGVVFMVAMKYVKKLPRAS